LILFVLFLIKVHRFIRFHQGCCEIVQVELFVPIPGRMNMLFTPPYFPVNFVIYKKLSQDFRKIAMMPSKTWIIYLLLATSISITMPVTSKGQAPCDTLSIKKLLQSSEQKRERGEYNAAESMARDAMVSAKSGSSQKWIALATWEQGVVQYLLRNYSDALDLFSRCRQINETLRDDRMRADILCYRAAIYINQRKSDAAEQDLIESMRIFEKYNDQKGMVRAGYFLGTMSRNMGKYDDALHYHESSLQTAKTIGYTFGIATNHGLMGSIYGSRGQFEEALTHFQTALTEWKKLDNQRGISDNYHVIGAVDFQQSNYSEALANYMTALKIRNQIGDSLKIAESYHDIGHIYYKQGNAAEALKNYLTSLRIFESVGNKERMAKAHSSIGNAYVDLHDISRAIQHFEFSKNIQKEINDKPGLIYSYNNLAAVYTQLGKYEKAEENAKAAKAFALELGDLQNLTQSSIQLSRLLLESKKPFEAKQQSEEAIQFSQKTGSKDYLYQAYLLLSEIEESLGHHQAALQAYKNYKLYEDSIGLAEKEKIIADLKIRYETEKKDHEIQLQLNKINKQTTLRNYLVGGFILFALLSFFVYNYFITRQKLKLQLLRNKIAIDLHDDVGSTLSSIAMFSEMAQHQSKEVNPLLDTIGENSRKMLDAMADIVWTINPENDQFENIILRMRSYAYEILGAKQIEFDFTADEDLTTVKLPMDVRKNLFLIFKEATNNIVKYANTDTAFFSIKNEKDHIAMMIRDNGKGFDVHQLTEGNGLKNMKKRAAEIGANLWIDSFPGKGTTIQFQMSI
jgi:two-component system sensor histidine kinase UhpB